MRFSVAFVQRSGYGNYWIISALDVNNNGLTPLAPDSVLAKVLVSPLWFRCLYSCMHLRLGLFSRWLTLLLLICSHSTDKLHKFTPLAGNSRATWEILSLLPDLYSRISATPFSTTIPEANLSLPPATFTSAVFRSVSLSEIFSICSTETACYKRGTIDLICPEETYWVPYSQKLTYVLLDLTELILTTATKPVYCCLPLLISLFFITC